MSWSQRGAWWDRDSACGNFSPLCLNFFLAWDYIFDLGLFCPLLTIDSASFSKNLGRNFWSKWKIKQKDKFSHYWFLIGHRDYDQKALILLYWLSSKQLLNPLSRIFFHKIAWKSQIIKWTTNWAENYSVYKILMRRNFIIDSLIETPINYSLMIWYW